MKKEDAEVYVKRQKEFYLDLLVYVLISIIFTVIWFVYDHGTNFWPKYIYFWGGLFIIYKFIKAGNLSFLSGILPFTDPDWEAKRIEKLSGKDKSNKDKKK